MHEDAPDVARHTRGLLYARASTPTQQDAGNFDRQLGLRSSDGLWWLLLPMSRAA